MFPDVSLSPSPSKRGKSNGVSNDFAENIFQPQGVPVAYLDSLDIPSFETITALATDSQGTLWVATTEGLVRFNGEKWTGFRESDGLISNNITVLAIAPDDSVRVGTSKGLSHFDGERWINYPQAAGLFPAYDTLTSAFDSFTVAGDGTVWAATDGSLFWFDGDDWNTASVLEALDIGRTWTLATGLDGTIWIGSEKGLGRYDGTHWSHYALPENLLSSSRPNYGVVGITTLAVAPDGKVWGGTSQGVVSFHLSETDTFLVNRQSLEPITPGNVDQIDQLAAFEQNTVCFATFSPDGKLLASSGVGEVVLQDVVSGSVLDTIPTRYNGVFRNIAFSLDGRLIAAPSTGNCGETSVQVWDVASKKLLLQRLGGFEHMATSVAFSPDGRLIAAGTGCAFDVAGSATVKVWNIESGMLVLDIPVPHFVRDVEFSPDGTLLAAASVDGVVRLWNAETGSLRSELQGRNEGVNAVVFSPDGTELASGGADVRLWDVASGEQIYLFEGLLGEAVDIAFNADGQLLVTGGGRHTLVFWDTATGAVLAQREVGVEDNNVYSVVFNADNTLLATCEHDNMLRLWGIPEK